MRHLSTWSACLHIAAGCICAQAGSFLSQSAYLKASNPEAFDWFGNLYGDEFGHDISLSGDTLVVGARNESSNAAGVNGD